MKSWSQNYPCCKNCFTTTIPHLARGLCKNCYYKVIESQGKTKRLKKGEATSFLSYDNLLNLYYEKNLSLNDIAKQAGCSRQFVMKKVKEYGIALRSKIEARDIALKKEKIFFARKSLNGDEWEVKLKKQEINENFFQHWSPQMAWVLGLIFTDGNMSAKKNTKTGIDYLRLSLDQSDPEILIKSLKLMNSNSKIIKKQNSYGDGYGNGVLFSYGYMINNQNICNDLLKLGVTPKKSLTIKFPVIPKDYIRHFIRGCWDGDGSIFKTSAYSFRASYVSGSYDFIIGMMTELKNAGFEKIGFEQRQTKNISYTIRLSGNQICSQFYKFLYDEINSDMYLRRKYLLFKEAYEQHVKKLGLLNSKKDQSEKLISEEKS